MKKSILIFFVFILSIAAYFLLASNNLYTDTKETMIVKDSTNTDVAILQHPKKIVFLNASNLEIFTSIGGKATGKISSNSYPQDILKDIEKIPDVGMIHAPNVEKIVSLKPDLVVGTQVPFHLMLRKPLEIAGIPLYINMINSYEDVLKSIDFFGKLAGTEKQATAKKIQIEQEYAELTKNIKPNQGPKTLIIFGSPDSFSMATEKSFAGDLLQKLGGKNIASELAVNKDSSYLPLSMEYITKKNPELILVITMGNSDEVMQNLYDDMKENTIWQDVAAVKNKKIYQLPSNLFTVNPGTHIIDSMKLMQQYLYGGKVNVQ